MWLLVLVMKGIDGVRRLADYVDVDAMLMIVLRS
jgi:hypothetical protein